MKSQSKRRVVPFISVPLVGVFGFLLVAKLAAWQQSDVISELADQLAHGETAEAVVAVRQLAAMPNPPLSMLVKAATSDDHKVAEAAQVSINRLLRQWQRQLEARERVGKVAGELAQLAEALARERRAFPSADYRWVSETTRKIVRLANQCPSKQTPLVAMQCDEIMSVVGASAATTPIASGIAPLDDGVRNNVAPPPSVKKFAEPREARLDQEFTTFASQPSLIEDDLQAPSSTKDNAGVVAPIKNSEKTDGEGTPQDETNGKQPLPRGDHAWRSGGTQPIFRILPAMPMRVSPSEPIADANAADSKMKQPELGETTKRDKAKHLAADDARELFERWNASEACERFSIERAIADLGFGRPTPRLVEEYLSDNSEDRLKLVEHVLLEPGVEAKAWLFLLAEDTNADVRLAAATVMATSDDETLIDKAWQIAIRDRDPRIADLAGRLRAKREGTQRR